MERRMRWKLHVRCEAGEKLEITSKAYLIPNQKLNNNVALSDIAEIFTRINSGGVTLTPEDFIMVTMTDDCISENEKIKQLIAKIKGFGFKKPKNFMKQVCYAALLRETGKSQAIKAKLNKDAIKT